MNGKKKGTAAEHRARKMLEAAGYHVIRGAGSLGLFDLWAIGPHELRCIQVKAGTGNYVSAVDRERMVLLRLPDFATKEIWRFPDRCREPLIERL